MAKIAPYAFFQEFDDNGDILAGGKLYTYDAGTTTPKATYTDASEDTANANPVILDASGRADVWLGAGAYKFVLRDANDVLIKEVDDITGDAANVFGSSVVDISTNTNITSVYQNNLINCTASVTLSLLDAATAGEGFLFSVKNSSAGNVTIDPDGSETIDGASTLILYPNQSCIVNCTGSSWISVFQDVVALQKTNAFTGANSFASETTFTADTVYTGSMLKTNKGADIASASALPLLTDGNFFDVTGTTTITSINTSGKVGTKITLQFGGILILTHHATDLILPTGANITTAAGDVAEFVEYASGDWVCTNYERKSGIPLKSNPVFHVRDEKAAGTGGGTFTSGAWRTRTLNDELENSISGASLASNQITLPAGTYRVTASAPAFQVIEHQARLYNITDSATVFSGTAEISWSSNSTTSRSQVVGTFTISGTKVFELQHRCGTTAASTGFGQAANLGEAEIYSIVLIEKVS